MALTIDDGFATAPPFMSGAPQGVPTGVQFAAPLPAAGFPTFCDLWDGALGTNGVVVATTDPVNAGFTQFTGVTENTGSGGNFKYFDDGIGYKVIDISTGVTAVSNYGEFTTVGIARTSWFRWGAKFTANPAATLDVQQPRDSATRYRLRVNAAGTLSLVNGSTVVATTTATIPLGSYFRVEWRAYADAANGEMELRLFPDLFTDVPTEVLFVGGLNTGATEITNVRNGNPFATANVAYRMVGVGVSDMGWIGPLPAVAGGGTTPVTLTATAGSTATETLLAALTRSATSSGTASDALLAARTLTATVAGTATEAARVAKTLTASAAGAATIAALKVILRTLTATSTVAAAMTRSLTKTLTASSVGTATRRSTALRTLAASSAGTATLAVLKVVLRTLTASSTSAASVVRTALLTRTAAAASSSTTTRQANLTRAASSTSAATASRTALLTRTVTATSSATLVALKVILRTLTAASGSAAAVARSVTKTLTTSSTSTSTRTSTVLVTRSASSTSTATLAAVRAFLRTLTAAAGSSTSIVRRAALTRAAAAGSTATRTALVSKRLTASVVTAIAAMVRQVTSAGGQFVAYAASAVLRSPAGGSAIAGSVAASSPSSPAQSAPAAGSGTATAPTGSSPAAGAPTAGQG